MEKDDHSEDETQVEEPDPVTEESRDVAREPLGMFYSGQKSLSPAIFVTWANAT